ncbi:CBS domain-containing protein [Pontibacillus litoralis]|uniref:CBS domain-containing protein n=1 Tax=Pontibacillus litoralis JSM 072002 TaxID=1385512 RepID=A0A0A5HY89_9BACI|nr:CBS domain-containing protein [Pontibacillus litoralis]KGX88572.1 hypothetical protein N784_07835 [Pontibacillus litoralis JSM 072002]
MKVVKDMMTTDIESCSVDSNVYEIAKKMSDKEVGSIPICDEQNHLIGMVTDRDLVVRGYAQKKAGSTPVTDVMSEELVTCEPNTSLKEASGVMSEKQIRRLPIVDQGKLVGIVSLGDLSLDKYSNEAAGHALEEISERPELH